MKYLASFPESLYIPKDTYSLEVYSDRILTGEAVMSKSTVAICSLARDIEKVFPYTKERIEYLASIFGDARIVIVENDSKDRTKEFLREWQAQTDNYLKIISQDYSVPYLTDKSLERREIMAFQRNKYLEYIDRLRPEPDYLIVLDSDIKGGYSFNGIKNSFAFNQDWSCMSSNSVIYRDNNGVAEKLFYDTYAFRKYGSWNEICGTEGNMMSFNVGEEPIPVYSNFGGLAIYRYNDIKGLRYTSDDCDHCTLNRQLIESGKNIYLNPSQICLQTCTSTSYRLLNE